jgi:hypothetical protein
MKIVIIEICSIKEVFPKSSLFFSVVFFFAIQSQWLNNFKYKIGFVLHHFITIEC